MQAWLKTTLVAGGGGAISALSAAIIDPAGFLTKYKFGSGKLALMMLEGAVVAVAALFMRSPKGLEIMGQIRQSQEQAKQDAALLDKVKGDITAGARAPENGKPEKP